ncbi:hypothetical protein PABG_04000 [Paracoccidioides brasiliensis Pb03]|nr:hypothetical protein PABG_04000 [Paracoccidioides brasiliensis Pb03]
MASADIPHDGLHHTVIISSDSEIDERQPPARNLRRKRPPTAIQCMRLNLTTRHPPKCPSHRKDGPWRGSFLADNEIGNREPGNP